MLFTTHIAVGALLGRSIGKPVSAAAVGGASHLAIDTIPHWGGDEGMFMKVAVVDGLAGAALTGFLVYNWYVSRDVADLAALVGGVAAGAPDWDKPCRVLLGFEPWPEPFNWFHRTIQNESPKVLKREVAIAAAAVGVCALVIGLSKLR